MTVSLITAGLLGLLLLFLSGYVIAGSARGSGSRPEVLVGSFFGDSR